MMNTRYFLTFTASLLSTWLVIMLQSACKETRVLAQPSTISAPKQSFKAQKTSKTYKNLTLDADTTCAGWRVILQSADAPYKVKHEDFYDKIVLITLYKDGKLLVDKQEFTTKNLHRKPQPYLQLYPAYVKRQSISVFPTAFLKAMHAGFTRSSTDKTAGRREHL